MTIRLGLTCLSSIIYRSWFSCGIERKHLVIHSTPIYITPSVHFPLSSHKWILASIFSHADPGTMDTVIPLPRRFLFNIHCLVISECRVMSSMPLRYATAKISGKQLGILVSCFISAFSYACKRYKYLINDYQFLNIKCWFARVVKGEDLRSSAL